jgi:hypothetical protein
MEEFVYSAESKLRSPARFVADTRADLKVSPPLEATRGWPPTAMTAAAREFVCVPALTPPVLLAAWLLQRLARPHVVARLG